MKTPDGTISMETMTQPKIAGYRQLSPEDAGVINSIKQKAEEVQKLLVMVDAYEDSDPRWLAIARTTLQTGFMQLTRAVAKPTTF